MHLYWKIDNERVWDILTESLPDLDAYLEAIGRLVEAGSGDESPTPTG